MNLAPISLLGLGFLSGIRHAFDIDHIAAISTIVSKNYSLGKSSLLGMFWGFGHTISLFFAGLIVLLLKITIPDKLALSLEFIVAAMLVLLGANVLASMNRNKVHIHRHSHGKAEHIHFHSHRLMGYHGHRHVPFKQSLVIGLIHGLAGSAALTLLILSGIASVVLDIAYILLFGAGSILGMMIVSSIISLPFKLIQDKMNTAQKLLKLGTGLTSIITGFAIII